jgi:hypothetical protein
MRMRYHVPTHVQFQSEASEEEKVRLERALIDAIRRAVESASTASAEIVTGNGAGAQEDAREQFSSARYRSDRGTYAVPSYDDGGSSAEVSVEESATERLEEDRPVIEITFPGWVWFTFMEGRFLVRIQADWLAHNVYGASEEETLRLWRENRRPDIRNPSLPVEYFIGELESRTGLRLLPAARREIEARGRIPLAEYQDFHYAIFLDDADLVRWFGAEQWSRYLRRTPGMPESAAATGREGVHPVEADRSVLEDAPELSRLYLLLMEHFTGLDVSTEIIAMAQNGLDAAELTIIIGDHPTRGVLTDIFTQGWREYQQAGGTGVMAFEPLIERILEQYLRGNLNATANRLKIGHGWPERDILGIVHRYTNLLLYDQNGMPIPSLVGIGFRDNGYISFDRPEALREIAETVGELGLTIDESEALLFNVIGQVYGGDLAMVIDAVKATFDNIEAVAQRVWNGLGEEVRRAVGEVLIVVIVFMLGHATARFLMRMKNPYAIAVGLALEVKLRVAGYILGLSFLGQTWDILLRAAFHMSRVRTDENGRPTRLSEYHMDLATRPIQQLIANVAAVMGAIAFGAALRRIRAGRSRGVIENPNEPLREFLEGEGVSETAPEARTTEGTPEAEGVTLPEGIEPSTRVWVNTRSGRYHLPESRWYGKTVEGRYMTAAEAEAAGFERAYGGTASTSGPPPSSGVYAVERPSLGDPRVVIRSWIGESQARAGLEREMASAVEYGIEEIRGWQRAHSQGAGLGVESGEAIRLAPELVNQVLQNRGIEGFLRILRDISEGARLHLTTVTRTYPGTLRLMDIHYIVEVQEGGGMITLFEAAIEVQRSGRARAGVRLPGTDTYTWGSWVGESAAE